MVKVLRSSLSVLRTTNNEERTTRHEYRIFQLMHKELKMDKTDKLIDWKEDERKDRNRDGIDDDLEPDVPDVSAGSRKLAGRLRENTDTSPILSGGDIDARWDEADSAGDEAVAGSIATPEQNDTDDLGRGVGVTYSDAEELKVGEKEGEWGKQRWEVDPGAADGSQAGAREEDWRKRSLA